MGFGSCGYYSAPTCVKSRLSLSLISRMLPRIGSRRFSMPSCTLETRIRCVNEVSRCHWMDVGCSPVIWSFIVRPPPPSISLYFFLSSPLSPFNSISFPSWLRWLGSGILSMCATSKQKEAGTGAQRPECDGHHVRLGILMIEMMNRR